MAPGNGRRLPRAPRRSHKLGTLANPAADGSPNRAGCADPDNVPRAHKRRGSGTVPSLVRHGRRCISAPLLAACAATCVVLTPSASGAEPTAPAAGIRADLELYALERELATARGRVAALVAERELATAERAAAGRRLRLAQRTLAAAQRRLARVVRGLYTAGEPEPLAVLLGAQSLDEAERNLDALRRAALQTESVGRQARRARTAVERLARRLDARRRSLAALEAEARRNADSLAVAVERRRAYVAALARRESAARAAAVEREAAAASRRSHELTPAASAPRPAVEEPALALRGVRRLTVDAVGYSLPGTTASGLPVGHGVVAVDPAVIPLGTRFYVPGYGPAVAADVGTAVSGLLIDLWVPTRAEAAAWGRRTVRITLL
jgi:3D (Asp-Asp-Asp) domain-containing protein